MSEFSQPNLHDIDASIAELDAALYDPIVKSAVDNARLYNQLLAEQSLDKDGLIAIINELDYALSPLIKCPVGLYGNVEVIDTEGDKTRKYVEDNQAIFNGFTIDPIPVYADGELVDTRNVIKFHLYISITDENIEDAGEATHIGAVAELDAVNLEFSNAVSYERSKAWLKSYCPEIIDEIDARIMNTDGTEADAVMSLRGFKLDLDDVDNKELALSCISVYLSDSIQIDTQVAYSCNMNGNVFLYDGDDYSELAYIKTESRLGLASDIRVIGFRSDDNPSPTYLVGVEMQIVHPDRNQATIHCVVPIDTFKSFVSLRSTYYGLASD